MTAPEPSADVQPGREGDLVARATRVIVTAKQREHTAPHHWALALHRAGLLAAPKPDRTCCGTRMGGQHQPGCPAIAEALGLTGTAEPRRDRYAQCHGDCTVDCGACKGNRRPAEACIYCGRPHLGVELADCPPVPAEAQQDDECAICDEHGWTACGVDHRVAARPSADTETLRDVLLKHHPIMRSEDGPPSGCRCGQVRLGQDVIAHDAAEVLAALAGDAGTVRRVRALADELGRDSWNVTADLATRERTRIAARLRIALDGTR